ncbi:hypothetical protein FB451DRAFT_1233396 [Mycena latifolia]|nr:hypothetical protein FB451DRAFT_1233396 [Mycena latifolia]
MHQEVDIPDQALRKGLSFHGLLDYLLGVIPASKVQKAKQSTKFLDRMELYGPTYVAKALRSMATIAEAKSLSTMREGAAFAQVVTQGAALCIMMKKPSVVTVLTNGTEWKFISVAKTPDIVRKTRPRASASSTTPTTPKTPATRRSSRFKPVPKPASQPFKVSSTRTLDVLKAEDLPVILRLLRHAV